MDSATEPSRPARGTGKDALVAAVIEILTEHGVGAVTYRAVANRAGVTHGLVRHHFKSLDELLRTAVSQWAVTSIDHTVIEPGTGRIEDLGRDLPSELAEHSAEHLAMYELALTSARTGAVRDEMTEVYRTYASAVSCELERAGFAADEGRLGRLVFAAIDGLVLQQLVTGEPDLLEHGLEDLRATLSSLLS